MILLSNKTAQTLQPGQALNFDKVILKTKNGCECHNSQAPATTKLCSKGIYELHYSGNITSATAGAAVQIAIALGGQPLVETAMNSVPAAAGDLNNVSTTTYLRNCCCDLDRVSVINTGNVPVTIAPNSAFAIHRLS